MNKKLCRNVADPYFKQVWNLYESAFPDLEKRTLKKHTEALADKRFKPNVYLDEKDNVLGLCFGWEFSEFIYLEHLAVNPNFRNKGIGSEIITEFKQSIKPVILEIEPPSDEITTRRLMFYKRNNFIETEYTFKQLKYKRENKDLFLNLLCNKPMNDKLYNSFKEVIYRELTMYNE